MDKQERQNKESEILAAAEQEFIAKGYDGARTTSIAQAAGVTHAMLHYYFRTKSSFSSASWMRNSALCRNLCWQYLATLTYRFWSA